MLTEESRYFEKLNIVPGKCRSVYFCHSQQILHLLNMLLHMEFLAMTQFIWLKRRGGYLLKSLVLAALLTFLLLSYHQ